LGGEKSGHIVFLDKTTTGDGMLASLQVLSLMLERQLPLSELAKDITLFPQLEKNIVVREKLPLHQNADLSARIEKIRHSLGRKGEVIIRYSGTEPLLRITMQGEDEGLLGGYIEELASWVDREINGVGRAINGCTT
jgi:phosphoglucosamine mutase